MSSNLERLVYIPFPVCYPDPLLVLVCYSVSLLFAPSFCLISTCLTASLFPTLLYLLPYNWLLISYSSQISFLIPACWCAFLSCFPFNPCHLTSHFHFLLFSTSSFVLCAATVCIYGVFLFLLDTMERIAAIDLSPWQLPCLLVSVSFREL